MSTLYIFVSCCMEETRFNTLKTVVSNLKASLSEDIMNNMIVFDNASRSPGTLDILTEVFPTVIQSNVNVGLWSAVHWVLHNYKSIIDKNYEFVYVIESDCLHYDIEQIPYCEQALKDNPELASIRCQEFSVANRHLYDKMRQQKDSVKYAWVNQTNTITGGRVEFEKLEGYNNRIYKSNFLNQIPALNRLEDMKDVFDGLLLMGSFEEQDFRRLYHDKYKHVGILDGGMWDSFLGNVTTAIATASHTPIQEFEKMGYRTTRQATMELLDSFVVSTIKK